MRFPMVLAAAVLCFATVCFAVSESRVSRASILAVEHSINEKFEAGAADPKADPYYVLGEARGTYLEGYGALFTTELNLINSGAFNPNPFRPTISPQQISSVRDRKLKKLAELKETMRTLMMEASGTLDGLPPTEKVSMEAILFSYSWENSRGMPRRLFMSAVKQKLLDAKASHATQTDLATVIEEQER